MQATEEAVKLHVKFCREERNLDSNNSPYVLPSKKEGGVEAETILEGRVVALLEYGSFYL